MKKVLMKYLCVGLAWSFLIASVYIGAKFSESDATFLLLAWLCFLILKRDYEQKVKDDEKD